MDERQQLDLERELDNWGAWARAGLSGPGTCASAESRYVPPRDDDGTRAARLACEPIRVADAERIERAVLQLRTKWQQQLLVMVYVHRAPQVDLARYLNVRPMLVRPATIAVLGQLQYVLEHTKGSTLRERAMRRGLHSAA